MKCIAKKIAKMSESYTDIVAEEQTELQRKLDTVTEAIANITGVIMSGMVSEALTDKLAELENEKAILETSMTKQSSKGNDYKEDVIDSLLIPREYEELKKTPASPVYKTFIQSFIDRIEVGRYRISITIKTGLDIFPKLDTPLTVSRKEIYEQGKIAS